MAIRTSDFAKIAPSKLFSGVSTSIESISLFYAASLFFFQAEDGIRDARQVPAVTSMADPMRSEEVTLKDRRRVVIRPSRLSDAESLLRNVNLIGREEVYILIDQLAPDLEHERQRLGAFEGLRALFVV